MNTYCIPGIGHRPVKESDREGRTFFGQGIDGAGIRDSLVENVMPKLRFKGPLELSSSKSGRGN